MFASYSVHDPEHLSRLVVPIQGVRVGFSSRLEGLITFARTHFGAQDGGAEDPISTQVPGRCSGQAEIEACLEWVEGTAPKLQYETIAPHKVRPDRDIEIGGGEITWSRIDDFVDLHLRFFLERNCLRLQGRHFFSLSRSPLRNRIQKTWYWRRLPRLREGRFSTILYYMVYYPTFWWLERQGIYPLHAAAVDLAGTGVILCGLPGCGKSTLSLGLLSLPETRLVSDNIIFVDGENAYRCPEPLLVDDRSLELGGKAASLLRPLGRRHAFNRAWCHVAPKRLANQTKARLFFFVRLGQQGGLRLISKQEAYQHFVTANLIAKEMRRYVVFRSVLGLGGVDGSPKEAGSTQTVQTLLNHCQCYELTVGWGDNFEKTLTQVHKLLASVS